MEESIYEYISRAIKRNGTLDINFNLDDYIPKDTPQYDLGAKDALTFSNILLTGQRVINKDFYNFITEMLLSITDENIIECLEEVECFFESEIGRTVSVFGTIEEIMNFIDENIEKINMNAVYDLCEKILLESCQIEAIKFAISMWSTTQISDKYPIFQILLRFALCEEFTFYVNLIFNNIENGNYYRFLFAKKLNGWGKIFLVEDLEVTNDSVKEWLITNGARNYISNSKNAYGVAMKINLVEVLKRDKLSEDEFEGICQIIEGLLISSSQNAIDKKFKNYMEILTLFLEKLENFKYNIEFLRIALLISTFLTKKTYNTETELNMIIYISNLFAESEVFEIIENGIKEGSIYEVEWCTLILSYYGNMELYDDVVTRFKEAPLKFNTCLGYLLKRKDERDKIIRLLENDIDENKMTDDVQAIISYSNEYYEDLKNAIQFLWAVPFKAEKVINAGLRCKVILPRKEAISIIEEWLEKNNSNYDDLPESIKESLTMLKQKEVIKDLKERINKIIGIEEDLSKYEEPIIKYEKENSINIMSERIYELFSERIIERGIDYYEHKMVYSCNKYECKYTAYVQGSKPFTEYEVEIYCDNHENIKKMTCNCPYEGNCKHELATLIKIRDKYLKDE